MKILTEQELNDIELVNSLLPQDSLGPRISYTIRHLQKKVKELEDLLLPYKWCISNDMEYYALLIKNDLGSYVPSGCIYRQNEVWIAEDFNAFRKQFENRYEAQTWVLEQWGLK